MPEQPSPVRVVLVDEAGSELVVHDAPESSELGPALRDAGHWIGDQVEQAREFRAAAGPRLGPVTDSAPRRGSGEDVVTPLAVAPVVALADPVATRALADPIGGLTVEPAPALTGVRGEFAPRSWPARLRTGPFGRRSAILRLRPSPSLNLTIIELVPTRASWFRSKSFVRAGVPVLAELAERIRLAAMVTESAKTPTAIGKSTSCA